MKTLTCDFCGVTAPGLDWFTLERFDDWGPSMLSHGDATGPWHFDTFACLASWAQAANSREH
jgi:hypothetical protein